MELFDLIFKRIESFIKSSFSRLSAKLTKIKRLPAAAAKKSKELLKDAVSFIIRKPSQLSDYLKISDVYIAKRALLAGIIIAAAVIMLVIWWVIPFLSTKLFTTRIIVNTADFFTANGRAEVYNADNTLLYVGELSEGAANGEGRLYKDSALVYQGGFENNEYSGFGKEYENNTLRYEGEFLESRYNGTGKLYSDNGRCIFVGGFADGRKSGEGELRYDNGNIAKKGTFSGDKLDGFGAEYDINGDPVYIGDYADGKYSGEGELYEDGELLYKGGFSDGSFSGEGELYEDGRLLYKGGFVNGEKGGNGTEYGGDGEIVYKGGFDNGEYSGEGVLYNNGGETRIEGIFENGLPNGGCKLTDKNGSVVFDGMMAEGEINYPEYISSDRAKVEAAFLTGAAEREVGDYTLLFYSEFGCGFLFDESGKTDRVIFTGTQELYNVTNRTTFSEYVPPEGAVRYDLYSSNATDTEKKLMNYIGVGTTDSIVCKKYIIGNTFVKLFGIDGEIVFYEVGII